MTLRLAIKHRHRPPRLPGTDPAPAPLRLPAPPITRLPLVLTSSTNRWKTPHLKHSTTRCPSKVAAPTAIAVKPEAAQDSWTCRPRNCRPPRRPIPPAAPAALRVGSHRWLLAGGDDPAPGHQAPTPPATPPGRASPASAPPRTTTSPRPTHHSITCRTHFINESMERSAPHSPSSLTTPRTAAWASRASPSLPALLALIAWPALPSLPAPAIPGSGPRSRPSSSRRQACPE